jgi:hypothetical protein
LRSPNSIGSPMSIASSRQKQSRFFERPRISSRRVMALHDEVARCRHGHELEETATEEVADGWMIWGRYSCSKCGRIGLNFVSHPPDVILVDDRRLVPRKVRAS